MIGRVGFAAAALAALAARAHADPWKAETAAGVEYDSNVRHVEQDRDPQPRGLLRAAARLDARGGEPDRLRWSVVLGGTARTVRRGDAPLAAAFESEDAVTGAVDLAATRRAGEHLTLGARVTHYEVWPLDRAADDPDVEMRAIVATRAFASSGADLSVVIGDDRGRRAAIAVGARRLVYKPDADFDWTGPVIAALVEDPVWRGADDRAIDLEAGYRLERRTYQGLGYQNGCAPGERLEARCYVPGDRVRADLVHVASVRATYTGARVASLGYELIVDDSTSFGNSLVRQRLTASVTTPLPARIFATATVTAQIDHYPEPPLVSRDIANQDFTSLDDESRSGAAIRLARPLGPAWQLEARWSIQASGFADDAPAYRRQLAYAGVTWER